MFTSLFSNFLFIKYSLSNITLQHHPLLPISLFHFTTTTHPYYHFPYCYPFLSFTLFSISYTFIPIILSHPYSPYSSITYQLSFIILYSPLQSLLLFHLSSTLSLSTLLTLIFTIFLPHYFIHLSSIIQSTPLYSTFNILHYFPYKSPLISPLSFILPLSPHPYFPYSSSSIPPCLY